MYVRAYVHIKRHIICICACRRVRIYIHMTSVHAYLPAYLHTYLPTYLHTYIQTYRENPNTKTTSCGKLYPQKMFSFGFPWKKLARAVVHRNKMVLDRKTNFSLGNTQITIFCETIRPKSKQIVFLFCLGQSWFFTPKPTFS